MGNGLHPRQTDSHYQVRFPSPSRQFVNVARSKGRKVLLSFLNRGKSAVLLQKTWQRYV